MWFCVKCGRSVKKDELIRGYCPDCFVRSVNIFESIPEIKLVVCPKCYSWLHQGEWNPPAPENMVLENIASRELQKHLIEGTQLLEVHVDHWEYVDPGNLKFNATLSVAVDGKPLSFEYTLTAKIIRKVCPRCVSIVAGKHDYLVQIRFTERDRFHGLLGEVLNAIFTQINREALVSVKEVPEGVDLELDDGVLVKKILELLTRKYAARVNVSFKTTKYDAHQGKWIGVTTYVARIPVFQEKDIVIYRGKLGLVKLIKENKLILWLPDTESYREVDVKEYWKGKLVPVTRVETEVYRVKDVDGAFILIENTATGDTRQVKVKGWLKNLKIGDRVVLIKANNVETLVPEI